jgi:hypothetical protein
MPEFPTVAAEQRQERLVNFLIATQPQILSKQISGLTDHRIFADSDIVQKITVLLELLIDFIIPPTILYTTIKLFREEHFAIICGPKILTMAEKLLPFQLINRNKGRIKETVIMLYNIFHYSQNVTNP